MEKYILKDETTSMQNINIEGDLVENLIAQIKQKDLERNSILDHLKEVEEENEALTKRISDMNKEYNNMISEKQNPLDYRDPSNLSPAIQRQRELEDEADNLSKEIDSLKKAMIKLEKEKNFEIKKLREDLEYERVDQKKIEEMERTTENLRKKIDEITEDNQNMSEQLDKTEELQYRVLKHEKTIKLIEEEKNKIMADLYEKKNKCHKLTNDVKKLINEKEILNKDNKLLIEKCNLAEGQSKVYEESLKNLKEEYETQIDNDKSLYSLDEEAKHKEELNKVRTELEQLKNSIGSTSKSQLVEFEAKVKNLVQEKEKLQEELNSTTKRISKTEAENEELKAQMEVFQRGNEAIQTQIKEYQRVKKDKDTLLELAKRAQDSLAELEDLKIKYTKLQVENDILQKKLSIIDTDKNSFENELKNLKEQNLQLTKKLTRLEQRNNVLQEYKARLEKVYKETEEKRELEFVQKLAKELSTQKETMKQKHKSKMQNIAV